jgi:hypothetical protein
LEPQHRADPRDQLGRAERLGDIVVGTDLQSANTVALLAARRQHDDRHVARIRFAPDLSAHFKSGDMRKHPVENHDVRSRLGDRDEGRLAVHRDRDPESFLLEIVPQQFDQCRFVFDDQK